MRVFLSAYSGFTLAIPMDAVASMVLYKQKTEKTVQYDPGSRSTYVSLPWLFNMPDQAAPHGVVMREWNTKENKVVLLTAEIKRDIEISDEEFYPIPKALSALRFSEIFSGIKFSGNPILLLNIEKLLQVIQNVQLVTDKKPKPLEPQPSPQGVEPSYQRYAVRDSPIEQPVPTAPSEPSPSTPNKVVEEPPIKESLVEKPPVEEPPKSPAVASEASSLSIEPQTSPQGVEPEVRVSPLEPQTSPQGEVSPLDEVLEVLEEPPISPAVTSDDSSLALNEVLEVCEITDEPPQSHPGTSEPAPPTPIEGCEDIEVCEVIEVCEDIKVCEDIEVCEVIEVCEDIEVCEVTEEPPISPAETSEPFSLALDEVIELCEI